MSIRNINSASISYDFQRYYKDGMNKISDDAERGTTGFKYLDFKSAAEDGAIENMLNLEQEESLTSNFQSQNRMALLKANRVHEVLSDFIERAVSLKSNFILRNSSARDSMGFIEIVKDGLQEIQSLLNTQFNGEFIFSGSMIDVPPVGDILNIPNLINDLPTKNYYQGDDNLDSVQIGSNIITQVGVKADDSGFKKVIAALHLAIKSSNPVDSVKFSKAQKYLEEGVSELITIRLNLGNNIAKIENIYNDNSRKIENIKEALSDIKFVSPENAMLSFKERITHIEALASFYSKTSQLNLDIINKFN